MRVGVQVFQHLRLARDYSSSRLRVSTRCLLIRFFFRGGLPNVARNARISFAISAKHLPRIHANQFKVYSIFLFSKNIPIFVAIKYMVYSLLFFWTKRLDCYFLTFKKPVSLTSLKRTKFRLVISQYKSYFFIWKISTLVVVFAGLVNSLNREE